MMLAFTLPRAGDSLWKLTQAVQKAGMRTERLTAMLVETPLIVEAALAAPREVGDPARDWAVATDEGSRFQMLTTAEEHKGPFVAPDEVVWPEGGDPREDQAVNYELTEVGQPWSDFRLEIDAFIERKPAGTK